MSANDRVLTLPLASKIPPTFKCDIEVWPISKSTNGDGELSPFRLGPCTTPDGVEFQNMENLWQFSKVYVHLDHIEKGKVGRGLPNDNWLQWHREGAEDTHAHRHPAGKGSIPAYSWWRSQCLSYIT